VNVCQHVTTDGIEVKPGHHEIIYYGAPGKCIMDIEVTQESFFFSVSFQA